MKSRLFRRALLLGMGISLPAMAQEEAQVVEKARADRPRLGLEPGAPQHRSVAPTLPFGVESTRSDDWVLDFHGLILVPLRVGFAQRANPQEDQSDTVLHNPPRIPQDFRRFEWTGAVPETYVQLNFSYGTTLVRGTAIIASKAVREAEAFFYPPDQLGLTDAFLTFDLAEPLDQLIEVNAGAFSSRYGVMGEYDSGRYGTPLIARINTVGESIQASVDVGGVSIVAEQGFGGGLGVPGGVVPAGWNDFADNRMAPTLVNHLHLGANYAGMAQLGLHYVNAWSQDDRIAGGLLPDGDITVLGADARLTLKQFGHLYFGFANASMTDATSVSNAIEILNARGGGEIIDNYLGPNSGGNGTLTTFGGQYDLSVGRMLFPELEGHGPDIFVSLFGMGTKVKSDDPAYTDALKLKFGAEFTYSAMSWLAFGARYDNVRPDDAYPEQNFQIISPRVIFHTDWNSQDQLVLQYSRFMYGDEVVVQSGFPPRDDPTLFPDQDVVTLSATVWW
jgi:hypothetical protein